MTSWLSTWFSLNLTIGGLVVGFRVVVAGLLVDGLVVVVEDLVDVDVEVVKELVGLPVVLLVLVRVEKRVLVVALFNTPSTTS